MIRLPVFISAAQSHLKCCVSRVKGQSENLTQSNSAAAELLIKGFVLRDGGKLSQGFWGYYYYHYYYYTAHEAKTVSNKLENLRCDHLGSPGAGLQSGGSHTASVMLSRCWLCYTVFSILHARTTVCVWHHCPQSDQWFGNR